VFEQFSLQQAQDFYGAIEWVAKQPWCSGKVGTWGISYWAMYSPLMASTTRLRTFTTNHTIGGRPTPISQHDAGRIYLFLSFLLNNRQYLLKIIERLGIDKSISVGNRPAINYIGNGALHFLRTECIGYVRYIEDQGRDMPR